MTALEEIAFVARHLEVSANESRRVGERRMSTRTLDAFATRLRRALAVLAEPPTREDEA